MTRLDLAKKVALERLKELSHWSDDNFMRVDPHHPMSCGVVCGIASDVSDGYCYDELQNWTDEDGKLFMAWFLPEAENHLWDRIGEIDYEAHEKAGEELRATLESLPSIKRRLKNLGTA